MLLEPFMHNIEGMPSSQTLFISVIMSVQISCQKDREAYLRWLCLQEYSKDVTLNIERPLNKHANISLCTVLYK